MDQQFRSILTWAAAQWYPMPPGVDPNTFDLFWVARRIEQRLGLPLPQKTPSRELGVTLVDECVDGRFIHGLIRDLAANELVRRGWDLASCAIANGFSADSELMTLVVLLHAWTGCIGMAKSLRKETSAGEIYTEQSRRDQYEGLREQWEDEERRANVWVRYGVTLARRFEERRGNPVVEDWVPKNSPYWEERG